MDEPIVQLIDAIEEIVNNYDTKYWSIPWYSVIENVKRCLNDFEQYDNRFYYCKLYQSLMEYTSSSCSHGYYFVGNDAKIHMEHKRSRKIRWLHLMLEVMKEQGE